MNGTERNYNAKFRNCIRDDYEMMYDKDTIEVSRSITNLTDIEIGTKLCPDVNISNEMWYKMYLQNQIINNVNKSSYSLYWIGCNNANNSSKECKSKEEVE